MSTKKIINDDRCVICGAYVADGSQFCKACYDKLINVDIKKVMDDINKMGEQLPNSRRTKGGK